jgi:hypothetical protein
MQELFITINGTEYQATYNPQSGFYELELTAPSTGGIYNADISYTDFWGDEYTDDIDVQVFEKKPLKLNMKKDFLWIFDYKSNNSLIIKDIVEIADYELNIDEETNAKSVITILKKTNAKARDIVCMKKNNEVVFWGMIEEVQNENGSNSYQFVVKYITNLFDREIQLTNESVIRSTGIEDFLKSTIELYFTQNTDTMANIKWLDVVAQSHNTKETSVTNVENGIYNFHTWLTNCSQNYDLTYSFNIVNNRLQMKIKCESADKQLIDTKAQSISNYQEVFETDVTSKVIVLYNKKNEVENPGQFVLYLKTDRTTTTNMNDENRADGKITTVYTENYEDAQQTALDEMKSNEYNHNITFCFNEYIKIGTPIAIKTKESLIFNSYISAVKITQSNFFEYQCGNIRINFLEKLRKERKK